MDKFEDAVARARATQQNNLSQASDRQHEAAQIGIRLEPELRQLLVKFARHLAAKTPANSYKMYRRGALDLAFSAKSPVGVPISVRVGGDRPGKIDDFRLITLDGRLWNSPLRLSSVGARRKNGGTFVDLSATALASTLERGAILWGLTTGGLTAKHGTLEIENTDRELPTSYQPLEDVLGELAVQLELNPVTNKAPEFFR